MNRRRDHALARPIAARQPQSVVARLPETIGRVTALIVPGPVVHRELGAEGVAFGLPPG
ncbi:MAG: hypothetical protein KY469_18875 [Actinobacteria bacterium]|nr:hypothetical protein [Actinomycetota bacterium]